MTASNASAPPPSPPTPSSSTQAPTSPQPGYPDADSRYAEVDGIQVHHKVLPSTRGESAPVAVCLHGFGASLFSFEACAALRSLLTLVPYDTPGFGFTSRPPRLAQYTRRVSAAIATALADAYAPTGRYALLAHSMGASTAARVILPDPARLCAVVLIAPALQTERAETQTVVPPRRPSMLHSVMSFLKVRVAAVSGLLLGVLTPLLVFALRAFVSPRSFWENGVSFSWPPDTPPPASVVDGYRRPINAPLWETGVLRFARAALRENGVLPEESGLVGRLAMLGPLAPPILIVHGDGDKIVPVANSRRLAQLLPTATLVEIPGAGHAPHEERPEQFTAVVESYLTGLGILQNEPSMSQTRE